MSSKLDLFILRDYAPGDNNFVYSTWLNGLYYGNDWFKQIKTKLFISCYSKVIESILKRPNVKVSVMALKEDPDVIIGYSVTEPNTLHWIFVKQIWRRLGVGSKLMPENCTTVTHLTRLGAVIKPKEIEFNPFFN